MMRFYDDTLNHSHQRLNIGSLSDRHGQMKQEGELGENFHN